MKKYDKGLSHVALPVTDLNASISFYACFARLTVVHRRETPTGADVAWLADEGPFVLVLLQIGNTVPRLEPPAHIGVACDSRAEVDRLCRLADKKGCLVFGPADLGEPAGYVAFLSDPDGHTLELSFGQNIAFTVSHSSR